MPTDKRIYMEKLIMDETLIISMDAMMSASKKKEIKIK